VVHSLLEELNRLVDIMTHGAERLSHRNTTVAKLYELLPAATTQTRVHPARLPSQMRTRATEVDLDSTTRHALLLGYAARAAPLTRDSADLLATLGSDVAIPRVRAPANARELLARFHTIMHAVDELVLEKTDAGKEVRLYFVGVV
jgi:hypothetical protein